MKGFLLKMMVASAVLFCYGFFAADAQLIKPGESVPEGAVIYSLPSTSLHLAVEAVREVYTPGPYAKFAKKYIGIDVPTERTEKYSLLTIKLTPYLEADPSARYSLNLSSLSNPLTANFFKMSSQGIVMLSDEQKGYEDYWRFPTLIDNFEPNAAGATSNFTSAETTLYKNVKNASGGYDKVAFQQSQVVEKSVEKKASETAAMIFELRKKRVSIITGDTDATFSGEALGAAIKEIERLESDLMSLFIGKTESAMQKMNFDVLPKTDIKRQLYVAFRMSDSQGLLLPNNDVSGRPILMEIIREVEPIPVQVEEEPENSKKSSKKSSNKPFDSRGSKQELFYRVPSVCLIKILDGQELLLQSRVPVYQLGETISFPLETIITR